MQDVIEDIREQIHEIRNILGPIDYKLENLAHQITASRLSFESKISGLETRMATNALRISEHDIKIAEHSDEFLQQSERIKRIELFLKMPLEIEKSIRVPAHEDKANPSVLPPQKPSV
jgi:2C-methyl-D-erythritol 2,4-cyclodiphosphate synthase